MRRGGGETRLARLVGLAILTSQQEELTAIFPATPGVAAGKP